MLFQVQRILPQHLLTRLASVFANISCAWFKNILIQVFIWYYHVDLTASKISNPKEFESFNAFFTRALKNEARPIASDESLLVSPADSSISEFGHIQENQLVQAKGHHYTLESLLTNAKTANCFENGEFITLYLSPRDYHRVHMPFSGTLKSLVYIPGKLFSVNQKTTENIRHLFARNERLVCLFETKLGEMALIFVGAMIVGKIVTPWLDTQLLKKSKTIYTKKFTQNNTISLEKGEQLGYFELGSTVIVLFQEKKIKFHESLKAEKTLLMGEAIAKIFQK